MRMLGFNLPTRGKLVKAAAGWMAHPLQLGVFYFPTFSRSRPDLVVGYQHLSRDINPLLVYESTVDSWMTPFPVIQSLLNQRESTY
jgi:hypothetical protein